MLSPKVEVVKSREIQAECFLDFEVNKINIRPEYMNNPRELAKIRVMIDDLKLDPSIKVNRLDIIGYASPEGTLATNKRLSEGRAMLFAIIWHLVMIFRVTNIISYLVVKTGMA